jgi:cysteine desulfurase
MGVGDDVGRGAVRISLGTCSPEDGHEKILKVLLGAYDKLLKVGS